LKCNTLIIIMVRGRMIERILRILHIMLKGNVGEVLDMTLRLNPIGQHPTTSPVPQLTGKGTELTWGVCAHPGTVAGVL